MQNSATNCTLDSMEEEAKHDAIEMRRNHEQQNSSVISTGDNPATSQAAAPAAATTGAVAVADSDSGIEEAQLTATVIPKERCKVLLALLCMITGMLLAATSWAFVHDRIPDTPPLPDISLELFANLNWAIFVCEVLLLANMITALTVSILHKHRWVVLRRIFFIVGIVFTYRAITVIVTTLPHPNWRNTCGPKSNSTLTFVDLTMRVSRIVMSGGFSVNKSHNLCGDSIFSGHTASLTLSYLAIRQYTPPAAKPLRWISLLMCLISFVCLILSHSHYTVDLVIGYWLASRIWLICHTLADFPAQRKTVGGHLVQIWWFPMFNYLEANVHGRLPSEMELPWRGGCFQRAYQRIGNFRMRLRSFIR